MPMPSIYVTRFFQLITARRFAEAERVLLRLRQKIPRTEWNTGYFQALRGMLMAQKSNDDRYVFLSNLNLKNQDKLQEYRREFLRHARNKLHADYDRGYFTAWASYMRVLAKLEFDAGKMRSRRQEKKEITVQTKAKKKAPEAAKKQEEKTQVEKRKEAEKEIKTETEKSEIGKPEDTEGIEPRQRTLFDFSR